MTRQRPSDTAVRLARGRNLAQERARRGLTLAALGYKVGVSAEQVRKYQNGRDFLGPTTCWRFAKALDCSFDRLFETAFEADGVAEPAAVFEHEGLDARDEGSLDEVLVHARTRLTGQRRADLRDILLDILEREERGAP